MRLVELYETLIKINLSGKDATFKYSNRIKNAIDNSKKSAMYYDLILTDIGLPGINGNVFTILVRSWEKITKQREYTHRWLDGTRSKNYMVL